MNSTIWKFPLAPYRSTLDIPRGGEILCMQSQGGTPTLWIKVNPDAEIETRVFIILPTGRLVTKEQMDFLSYVGTYQQDGGTHVWHVFEDKIIVH